MSIEDILFDNTSMANRLVYSTRNDLKLTTEQANEIIDLMRMESRNNSSGHPTMAISFRGIPVADRAALVFQFFINLSQAGHIHSPIADNLVALSLGYSDLRSLINAIKPQFCDSHSSDPREIKKCVDTWGIPTPAQFIFGREYTGITVVTGGSTRDIRRLIAQEMTLIEPNNIKAAIFTDSVLPYTLENFDTPAHFDQLNLTALEPYNFFTIQSITRSNVDLAPFTSIIWDSAAPVPSHIVKSRSQALVIISESVSSLSDISPDYIVVTEPDKLTETLLFQQYPVLKKNKAKYFAQQYRGDAIFHVTHSSGTPQRTIGYPWFPEKTKDQHRPMQKGFLSRLISRKKM